MWSERLDGSFERVPGNCCAPFGRQVELAYRDVGADRCGDVD